MLEGSDTTVGQLKVRLLASEAWVGPALIGPSELCRAPTPSDILKTAEWLVRLVEPVPAYGVCPSFGLCPPLSRSVSW